MIFCWGLFCEHFLTLVVDTCHGHFNLTLFLGTFCGHFLWTLFVDTFFGHFLGRINGSAEIMVNKKKLLIYFLPRNTSYELPGSTDHFCLLKV